MENFIEQNKDLYRRGDDIADKLQAFANGNRLRILCYLAAGPLSVGEIVEYSGLSQSAVSQHLAKLKSAHIVTCKKEAQTRYYFIDNDTTLHFMAQLHSTFCGE